jgi:hypothetical protein
MKSPQFLTVLLATTLSASAASTVLYQTGWEPSPASPAWVPGNLIPQNLWYFESFGDIVPGSNDRNMVVANGSADANPYGTPVVTPSGSQFHRFRASSSTTTINAQSVYPDVSGAFAARPPGQDVIVSSIDVFVPSGGPAGSANSSFYGLRAYDLNFNNSFNLFLTPNSRRLSMLIPGVTNRLTSPAFFHYDTWFNIAIRANFRSGDVDVFYNGNPVPELTGNNPGLAGSSLGDVDLFSQNDTNPPTSRIIFTDNYRITAESFVATLPRLTITPVASSNLTCKIKWPAANRNWILEYADQLQNGGSFWADLGISPVEDPLDSNFVYVVVGAQSLHRYFRLRLP